MLTKYVFCKKIQDPKDITFMVNDLKDKSYFEQPTIPTVASVKDEWVHTKYKNKEDEDKIPEITKVIVTGIKGFKAGHDTYQDEESNLVLKKYYVLLQPKRVSKKTAKFASYQSNLR
jgi:hypothetical protein